MNNVCVIELNFIKKGVSFFIVINKENTFLKLRSKKLLTNLLQIDLDLIVQATKINIFVLLDINICRFGLLCNLPSCF